MRFFSKILLLHLLFFSAFATTKAQEGINLVPNPSFEEYEDCPWGAAGINEGKAIGWKAWNWTPDYFNACSSDIDGYMGVPSNAFGFQHAISGNAYAGLGTYENIDPNSREYIAIELSEPLSIGQTYYVFFHFSFYEGMEGDDRWCASNNIGLRFFKDPQYDTFPPSTWFMPDNFAHLNYNQIHTDTTNWTLVEGWVTADQDYNWLAIGNFFDDNNTDTLILNSTGVSCFAYYFVENVCVSLNPEGCDYLVSTPSLLLNKDIKPLIYPNPTDDIINIEIIDSPIESIWLYDITGRLILHEKNISKCAWHIDVSMLPVGSYIFHIKANSSITNHKIFKQ